MRCLWQTDTNWQEGRVRTRSIIWQRLRLNFSLTFSLLSFDTHLPTCPLRSTFSRQGSSRPEGVVSEAVSWLRSSSPMSSGISAAEPTFRWDILMESSPVDTTVTGQLEHTLKGEYSIGQWFKNLFCHTPPITFLSTMSIFGKLEIRKKVSDSTD